MLMRICGEDVDFELVCVCVCVSPMIPLSLLSRVELGLMMLPQTGRPLLLFKVEQGLSVHGDAVLLVRVEHGLIP